MASMGMTSSPPPASAIEANRLGIAALQAGDAEAAARHFVAATAGDPHSGALQRNLASAWRALGKDDSELAALDAALAIDRRDLMAWVRKGERHEARGEKGAALAAWSAAIALGGQLKPVPQPLEALLAQGEAFVAGATGAMYDAAMDAFAAEAPALPLAVGFSGGADSSALLLACATRWPGQVEAWHVHHGLQAAADGFEQHCTALCRSLDVPLTVRRLDARHALGQSPEDVARRIARGIRSRHGVVP